MERKWVKKAGGEVVAFEEDKLRTSLFNAGASEELIDQIIKGVLPELEEVTTTKKIYKSAYKRLRSSSQKLAGKYKLKNAILEMGPSGYPFEHFVGHLLRYQGYEVEVGLNLQGRCLPHEVDIRAKNEETLIIGECKHHSQNGYKSDVKVPLYVHSRFRDIQAELSHQDQQMAECWIITNTRFTTDAQSYGACYNMKLISWDYPKKGNLKERIELSGYYPITCLYSLTKKEKENLMNNEVILCQELIDDPSLLASIDPNKHSRILKEANNICNY